MDGKVGKRLKRQRTDKGSEFLEERQSSGCGLTFPANPLIII